MISKIHVEKLVRVKLSNTDLDRNGPKLMRLNVLLFLTESAALFSKENLNKIRKVFNINSL